MVAFKLNIRLSMAYSPLRIYIFGITNGIGAYWFPACKCVYLPGISIAQNQKKSRENKIKGGAYDLYI